MYMHAADAGAGLGDAFAAVAAQFVIPKVKSADARRDRGSRGRGGRGEPHGTAWRFASAGAGPDHGRGFLPF